MRTTDKLYCPEGSFYQIPVETFRKLTDLVTVVERTPEAKAFAQTLQRLLAEATCVLGE
jgi:hypothetical protein